MRWVCSNATKHLADVKVAWIGLAKPEVFINIFVKEQSTIDRTLTTPIVGPSYEAAFALYTKICC